MAQAGKTGRLWPLGQVGTELLQSGQWKLECLSHFSRPGQGSGPTRPFGDGDDPKL